MKAVHTILLTVGLLATASVRESLACFDTYLFQQKKGMVYPHKMLAFDINGEYVINDIHQAEPDLFSMNLNVYYGLAKRISLQAQLASSEKERSHAKFDEWGWRGVLSLIRRPERRYNLDLILEHHVLENNKSQSFEVSTPSIWHIGRMTYVVHPVMSFVKEQPMGMRGHGGVFYSTNNGIIIGFGAEYESAQSSSFFGQRLVRGETGTSLFFGSSIGSNLYLQNELIKGWGAGGKDVGFALTMKVLLPQLLR